MLRRISLALAVAPILTACGNQNIIRPSMLVHADTLVAYAFTGTPATLPSALSIVDGTTVRVSGSAAFDVAFDFDAAGNVVVSPVRLFVSPLAGAPQVGLRAIAAPFDSIRSAPTGYYRPDTAIVVRPGEPFIVLSTRRTASNVCLYSTVPHIYAKVVIDSVFPSTTRAIYLRETVNPNCGYRSFTPNELPSF